MSRLTAWVARNIDGVVAFVAAIVIVVLDVSSGLEQDTVNSGILLVLGVLAIAMLRDRARKEDDQDRLGRRVDAVFKALDDASMVRTLSWTEVSDELALGRQGTDRYFFRGGTGTYTRAVTMPGLVNHARRDRRQVLVRLEIIDPTDEEVCETYARFRRSLSHDGAEWTPERTRREAYATIVAAAWWQQRYELLDVKIGLSRSMPTLRYDMSARSLVITQEHPRGAALLVDQGKLLYEYTATELRKSHEQARQVPLEKARGIALSDEPLRDEVHRLFTALDMPLPSSFLDGDVDDMIHRALHAPNPYDER